MARKRPPHVDPEALVARLGRGASILDVPDMGTIYAQGDAADSAFYVQRGQVRLVVFSKAGKEAVLATLAAGHFFGEGCLTANHPLRLSDAVAIGPATIVRIRKVAIIDLLHGDAAFADAFLLYMITRTRRVEEDLIDQLFNSSEKRLARALLQLAKIGKHNEPPAAIPKLSQQTLAHMVGTTRPRINQFLNKFRDLGFIEYNGELRVHNSLLDVVLRD